MGMDAIHATHMCLALHTLRVCVCVFVICICIDTQKQINNLSRECIAVRTRRMGVSVRMSMEGAMSMKIKRSANLHIICALVSFPSHAIQPHSPTKVYRMCDTH